VSFVVIVITEITTKMLILLLLLFSHTILRVSFQNLFLFSSFMIKIDNDLNSNKKKNYTFC
jgi:hypothetical protein